MDRKMAYPGERTAGSPVISIRKLNWTNTVFFFTITAFSVVAAPLYFSRSGVSAECLLIFSFYIIATSLSITAGYHRLFSHATYKASAFVRFMVLFFGAAAFQQSALKWASQHRYHHLYVDTDRDPYDIKKGFFYAHIGWLIFGKQPAQYENVRDLQTSYLVMHQHRFYKWWAITAGILLPVGVGSLTGDAIGAFLLSVCVRLTLVYHATWCINSVCHTFGKSTYDIHSSAKDHWLAAMITNGEGYHNYHHHFPGDYRNGVRWYHWDPTKWLIAAWSKLGLAWNLRTISEFKILAARLAAENQAIEERFQSAAGDPGRVILSRECLSEYEKVSLALRLWELARSDYQSLILRQIAQGSDAARRAALKESAAERHFDEIYSRWQAMVRVMAKV